MEKQYSIDIPLFDSPKRFVSMDELMAAFYSYKETDSELARTIIEYACDCGHIPAKLAYSSFLRTNPTLMLSQADRYEMAEALLLELHNMLDVSDYFAAEVAIELGNLYADCLHRPIGALAMYLQAKRKGAHVEEYDLLLLQHRMENTDINQLGINCEDAYQLGNELMLSKGSFRLAELFLREAIDNSYLIPEKDALCGIACLALADLYNMHRTESPTYRVEAARMYAMASQKGYPEYLMPNSRNTSP